MSKRLLSLDVFRGMTVFFMIIVNTTGNWSATYAPLLHAPWHGFTPTDFVFPAFLIAIGASIAIVMQKWKSDKSKGWVYKKILVRSLLIFLIGYLLYWFPFVNWKDGSLVLKPFSETRIMGVLQRIGLVYGMSALLLYRFSLRNVIKITICILIAYWLVMIGFGDLTLEGNAANLLDLKIFGPNHLYKGEGIPFDPEGLLSTFPCIGNVVAGYATVYWMQKKPGDYKILFQLMLVGAALIGVACAWHYAFPINKKIWTSSYVLLTSGIGMLILVALHYLLDLRNRSPKWPQFFVPMGKNPLFIYLLSQIGSTLLYWWPSKSHGNTYSAIYQNGFKWMGDYLGAFLFAVTFVMICWLVAFLMDRWRWYVRL